VSGNGIRIYKTRWLARFARHEHITDTSLLEAIARAERGLIEADLGGGLIKQRVARQGQGRSGGYRMILAYRMKDRAVFLYAFAKNERENIGPDELAELRRVGSNWLNATPSSMAEAIDDDLLQEVDLGQTEET
jgi:hypothetical protein